MVDHESDSSESLSAKSETPPESEIKIEIKIPTKQIIRKSTRKGIPIILQALPPSPKDICECCDPFCENDVRLAWLSTLSCWLLLGALPVVMGIVGIKYAYKARSARTPAKRMRYSAISRSISWIGFLNCTIFLTVTVVILATFELF